MKTKLKITGDWNTLKAKLKKQHPELTNDDLAYTVGKEDELVTRLEKRLGETKENVIEMIENLQTEKSEKATSAKY